jgi:RNA polymerase sigma-70 factor (ECF subfamily)
MSPHEPQDGDPHEVTQLLAQLSRGDERAADQLMPVVFEEFRALAASYMAREGRDHTFQPTALVNEAYLRLVDQRQTDWKDRSHFFAIGAQAMRRVLVDHARAKRREKRGGSAQRVALHDDIALSPGREEDVLAVNDALERLAQLDPRQARIVELRFFAGLNVEEVAEVLGVSKRTVESDWTMVRAWLRKELGEGDPAAS